MRSGVPREIKNPEYRVGLTPPSAAELGGAGHALIVETGAGTGIDFDDADYRAVGATIGALAVRCGDYITHRYHDITTQKVTPSNAEAPDM